MNILWQNEHYPDPVKGGGGAVNTYYITSAMRELGHNVVILARGEDGSAPFQEEVKGTIVQRLAQPRLPEKLWPLWPLLDPIYSKKGLKSVCRDHDAFVGIDFGFALNAKTLFPARPLLYRVEGNEKSHKAAIAACGSGVRSSNPKRTGLARWVEAENEFMDRKAWRAADGLIVKSQFMKRELGSQYGLDTRNVHVIPNGVDFDRYAGAKKREHILDRLGKLDGRNIVVVFSGRLVAMKNVGLLIRAFAQMKHRARCILAILGEGEARSDLEHESSQLGIRKQVQFLGHTERVEEFLAAADIFVLPSVYEPFGNALVEAMAAGLSCIALKPNMSSIRTASDEIIRDGVTGFLVGGDGCDELSHRLDMLVESEQLRRAVGAAGQREAREKYSWIHCARSYLDLLGKPGAVGRSGDALR